MNNSKICLDDKGKEAQEKEMFSSDLNCWKAGADFIETGELNFMYKVCLLYQDKEISPINSVK